MERIEGSKFLMVKLIDVHQVGHSTQEDENGISPD